MEVYLISYHGDQGQKRQGCLVSIQHVLCSTSSPVVHTAHLLPSKPTCGGRHRDKFTKECSPGLRPSVKPFPSSPQHSMGCNLSRPHIRQEKGRVERCCMYGEEGHHAFACIFSPIQLSSNARIRSSW